MVSNKSLVSGPRFPKRQSLLSALRASHLNTPTIASRTYLVNIRNARTNPPRSPNGLNAMSTNARASTTNGHAPTTSSSMPEKSYFESQRELLVGEIAQVSLQPTYLHPSPILIHLISVSIFLSNPSATPSSFCSPSTRETLTNARVLR